ncbi:MAG: maleylpyruvate isomerase family mycothiol-dependent enzyme [Actinobacteria bacterium]|nr:maleylpyruvate isomerase family mycothiol-dependent enzyme [Actinomycetota bacterium]
MGSDVSYLQTLRADAAALAGAARTAGVGAPVPTCPGWDVEKLVRHVGRVHTSGAAVVRERAKVDFDTLPPMPKGEEAIAAFDDRSGALADALEALPEDFPIWNWFGIEPPIPGFYHRRMAQETAVHRWDAQAAAGTTAPIDTALAVDGIDELLRSFLSFAGADAELGGSIHLHATDADSEWLVRREHGKLVATPEHGKADVAVRGTASDLLLFIWNRVPASALDLAGDPAVADHWKDAIKF